MLKKIVFIFSFLVVVNFSYSFSIAATSLKKGEVSSKVKKAFADYWDICAAGALGALGVINAYMTK